MKKSTQELLDIISKNKNLDDILSSSENNNEFLNISLPEYLEKLLSKKQLTKAQVILKGNLNKDYAYQIFSGTKSSPSRDKLLAIAIGMSLTVDETQTMLKIAELPMLYPRKRRDMIILFAIQNGYDIFEINDCLDDLGEEIIFS